MTQGGLLGFSEYVQKYWFTSPYIINMTTSLPLNCKQPDDKNSVTVYDSYLCIPNISYSAWYIVGAQEMLNKWLNGWSSSELPSWDFSCRDLN